MDPENSKETAAGPSANPNAPAPDRADGARPKGARERTVSLVLSLDWVGPIARRYWSAFCDWLAALGWGKFFLLSMLLLVLASLGGAFVFGGSKKDSRYENGSISVGVNVVPMTNGELEILSAERDKRPAASATPPKAAAHHAKDDVLLQIDGDGSAKSPAVRIDEKGVRVLTEEDGHKVSVVIDHDGVRVEKVAPESGGGKPADKSQGPADRNTTTLPQRPAPRAEGPWKSPLGPVVQVTPAVPADPEAVADAVEAARGKIENILQEQVDRKLHGLHSEQGRERDSWITALTTMGIVALIMLKVVLGSKRKAETQARQASTVAAQEGLKRQLAEAQLKTMQAQVEPHFLFNTLSSVDYLIETDPARASRMQKNLIQYLRAALPQMREGSSNLGREISLCRSYLEILKVRMDDRLQFSINVPQGLQSAIFPPMMLQTLVENAIKHGLEPKPEGGSLSLSAVIADGMLRVAVADSGLGFGVAQRGGTGVGLVNVRERLQALFGSTASLAIEANSEGGTIVTIAVPYRMEPPAAQARAPGAPEPAPAV